MTEEQILGLGECRTIHGRGGVEIGWGTIRVG